MEIVKKLESINGLVTLEHEFLSDMSSRIRSFIRRKLEVDLDEEVVVLSYNLNIRSDAKIYSKTQENYNPYVIKNKLFGNSFYWNFSDCSFNDIIVLASASEGDLSLFVRKDCLESILSEDEIADELYN